ncbi:hypothetical protein HPP92_012455 [Vanilla planifolia]|uniref:BHLH domain-containing protein n=1 Tax=Vanilla planifolia TaxID=51239 RepID=A0A835QV72_VANPL|nr:hypothetical protein HPP92_012455 [Vanilla planifolia]
MDPNPIPDCWIDYSGDGSDGELCGALGNFCGVATPVVGSGFQEIYGTGCQLDQTSCNKRTREESCSVPKSKACREKLRRDRLNDRFLELNSVLDPGRPPKSDKASILSDAARVLAQLRSEAEQLKEANKKLRNAIKELKAEKVELRDEKLRLKSDKEKLEQQMKGMSIPSARFIPPPIAFHPAANPAVLGAHNQAAAKKVAAPFSAFPVAAMWQWLPPAFLDTSQDPKLWPPHA